jgi:hypothetical protein
MSEIIICKYQRFLQREDRTVFIFSDDWYLAGIPCLLNQLLT